MSGELFRETGDIGGNSKNPHRNPSNSANSNWGKWDNWYLKHADDYESCRDGVEKGNVLVTLSGRLVRFQAMPIELAKDVHEELGRAIERAELEE